MKIQYSKNLLLIFFVFILSCKIYALEFVERNDFISFLNTQDNNFNDKSNNVIQGITFFDNFLITSQTNKDEFLLINIFNDKFKSISNHRIAYPSHGQDLSINFDIKNNTLNLFTVSQDWKGIVSFNYEIEDNNIKYKNNFIEYNLNCEYHCTSTIDEKGKYFAVKDGKFITIYDKNTISMKNSLKKFKLDDRQLQKGQWFQGIELRGNLIYTLTSSANINDPKYLFVYDKNGNIKYSKEIIIAKELALKEGNQYEFEGLAFRKNNLYTTLMTGNSKKRIKRLYKILEIIE